MHNSKNVDISTQLITGFPYKDERNYVFTTNPNFLIAILGFKDIGIRKFEFMAKTPPIS